MTVFDAFKQVTYTYLVISRGETLGNRIVSESDHLGVFKLRSGMTQVMNQETRDSSATLHVHPEDIADGDEIVGNGVRYAGKEYSITGMTEGRNFDTNEIEHYTLTLGRAGYVSSSQED